jgi:hypothetical protein
VGRTDTRKSISGHAEVHLAAPPHLQLDTAVLGKPALGDVELGHDLDARGDGVLELERRLHHLVEHAIDAVARAEVLLVGLDVDVRRIPLDGVGQDEVHELDDRRVLGLLGELADVDVLIVVHDVDVHVVEVRHDVGKARGLVVVAIDRALDGVVGGDDDLDVVAGEELDVVDGDDVRGIRGGQDQSRPGAVHREDRVLDRDLFGDQLDDRRVDLELVEVDRWHAVLLGDEVGELGLLQVAELGDLGAEAAATVPSRVTRLAQLLGGEQVLLDEELADPLVQSPDPALDGYGNPPTAGPEQPPGLATIVAGGRIPFEPARLSALRIGIFTGAFGCSLQGFVERGVSKTQHSVPTANAVASGRPNRASATLAAK